MKNKITNRTQVYRAIYYSGFEWTKSKVGDKDSYILTTKDTNRKAYIDHIFDLDLQMDQLIVRSTDAFDQKELDRFSRLFQKIMRRTRKLGIQQDLIELAEEQKESKNGGETTEI